MASIRERNGKFNVIYSYTNEKGERKQKWETYETKAEAKRRKKEIEYKKEMGSFVVRKCKVFKKSLSREHNRSGRKVISYIGCNFFMTLLTRKLGMCIIKICKENLVWRCFYEKGRNLKCKQKRTSQ